MCSGVYRVPCDIWSVRFCPPPCGMVYSISVENGWTVTALLKWPCWPWHYRRESPTYHRSFTRNSCRKHVNGVPAWKTAYQLTTKSVEATLHLDVRVRDEIGLNLEDKWDKIKPPPERLYLTCGQLQLLTDDHSPRNWDTLPMGCVRASGVPDSSRRHPEIAHEVFSWIRSCEPAAQKNSQNRRFGSLDPV